MLLLKIISFNEKLFQRGDRPDLAVFLMYLAQHTFFLRLSKTHIPCVSVGQRGGEMNECDTNVQANFQSSVYQLREFVLIKLSFMGTLLMNETLLPATQCSKSAVEQHCM